MKAICSAERPPAGAGLGAAAAPPASAFLRSMNACCSGERPPAAAAGLAAPDLGGAATFPPEA
eukprot:4403700-Pyramimonas_sp.AAC.1